MNKIEKPEAKQIRKRVENRTDSDSEDDKILVNYSKKGRSDDEIKLGKLRGRVFS